MDEIYDEQSPTHAGAHSHGGIHMPGDGVTSRSGVRGRAGAGLDQAAEALRRAGRHAEERGGFARRAAPTARRVAESFDETADYVRATDVAEMRDDLVRAVRRSPLRSVLIAAVAGYLFGRVVR
ncbi:MAG: hypothetical protein ACRELD_14370 [Longimicrobiales bacterium]